MAIKPCWSERSWYSDTDLALGAPIPLSYKSREQDLGNAECVEMHLLPFNWQPIDRNQMKPKPACPQFDNKKADGPATKSRVNIYTLNANKVIRKLRTSIRMLLSNCTLFFTSNFREGSTFVHLISIIELILPSTFVVSQRLSLLGNNLGVDGYLGRMPPSLELVWGSINEGLKVEVTSLM